MSGNGTGDDDIPLLEMSLETALPSSTTVIPTATTTAVSTITSTTGLTGTDRSLFYSNIARRQAPLLQHGVGLPVVHIRTRPVLSYLGDTRERRCVWCLDQQNIVVRINRSLLDNNNNTNSNQGATSPQRPGNVCGTSPPSPHGSSGLRHSVVVSTAPSKNRIPGVFPFKDTGMVPTRVTSGKETPREKNTSRNRGGFSFLQPGLRISSLNDPDTSARTFEGSGREEHFTFDFIHGEDSTQEEIFEESVLDFVDMALLAQSVAIICYGPTGSGKTHSMMGSVNGTEKMKRDGAPYIDTGCSPGQRSKGDEKCRSRSGSRGPNRRSLNTGNTPPSHTTSTRQGGSQTEVALALPLGIGGKDEDQQIQTCTPERGTDMAAVSLSSAISVSEIDWLAVVDTASLHGPKGKLPGARNNGKSIWESDNGKTMIGLLPRLVLVLLERRGVTVALRKEDVLVRMPSLSRAGGGKEKLSEKQSGGLSLTLQDIVFYAVELYMDEFHDLLDPAKRVIPNVGDIGGLDAFCQAMNNPSTSTLCNGGGGSAGNIPFRGGGAPVLSVEDLRHCYQLASRNRVTKGHQRNDASSRSHAVFILQLRFDVADICDVSNNAKSGNDQGGSAAGNSTMGNNSGSRSNSGAVGGGGGGVGAEVKSMYSYVAMVDLAGSERVKETKVEGVALREAQFINKSLSALSAVLLALYQNSSHIPYRDSKLTRLLRPCLQLGHVLLLVHVTPCSAEEAVNSLRFAEQVRHTSVQTHNFLNATDDLLALFEDLTDPDVKERAEEYRQVEVEYGQLCAEIRLAYFSCYDDKHYTEVDSALFPQGLISDRKRRENVIKALVEQHLYCYRKHEEEALQREIAAIQWEWECYVENFKRTREENIELMQQSIEQLSILNARLAEENSQPVLRDAHAMAIKQRLKDISSEITEYAKEKLLLLEGIRTIRQRIGLQSDLEHCLNEQLQELGKTANTGNTPRLYVEGPELDEESEKLYDEQRLLSKEMSYLREESTCFVRSDEILEGLWGRVVRQELLIAFRIEMEMMEGILLRPQSLRWLLEANGIAPDEARAVACPASAGPVDVKWLLDTLATAREQRARSKNSNTSNNTNDASNMNNTSKGLRKGTEGQKSSVAMIPLTLSNGDEVKTVHTLIGCYEDEATLQEMSVEKLLHEGIYCAVVCPMMSVEELLMPRSSTSALSPTRGTNNAGTLWGFLRLTRPPKNASSYSLEFSQRTYANNEKVRERRIISIPLGEPQLRIMLHVIEAESLLRTSVWSNGCGAVIPSVPLIAMKLHGVHPSSSANTTQPSQSHQEQRAQWQSGNSKVRKATRFGSTTRTGDTTSTLNGRSLMFGGGENAAVRNAVVSRRLDCGGELLLPTECMAAFEERSGTIIFHFPKQLIATATRTEGVECIVAALSGLTLPVLSPLQSNEDAAEGALLGGIRVVTYEHLPHVLLRSHNGAMADPVLLRGMGIPSFGYASSMHVRFYFEASSVAGGDGLLSKGFSPLHSPRTRFSKPIIAASGMLSQLGVVSIPPGVREGGVGEGSDVDLLLSRMQQLYAVRRKTRAQVRQQIFDAEDIKAELLYSVAESEFIRGSHIKDVLREARDIIDLQHGRAGTVYTLRGPVHATPGLCREMCGAVVPWTLWQWAHWWKKLQEAHRQLQNYPTMYSNTNTEDDDDDDDSVEDSDAGTGISKEASGTGREGHHHSGLCFDDIPYFLADME